MKKFRGKTLFQYFKKAQKERWALGHFNFSTLEQLSAIVAAARNLRSPVILGTSEGESNFVGLLQAAALVKSLKEGDGFPLFLNLDHGKNLDYIKKAIDSGYDCVHFDGSNLSIKENIRKTKEVVRYAKKQGVLVEGEVGFIGGRSAIHKKEAFIKKSELTKPEEAVRFIKETKVDSLAIAIGNVHGIYQKMPELDFKRLREIKDSVDSLLVLHGSSGVKEKEIKKAIKLGIGKVNVNTDLRKAWRKGLEKSLKEKSKEVKPYTILSPVVTLVQKVVEGKIKLFGSQNRI